MSLSADPEATPLPNPLPRPAGELEELRRLWRPPRGLRAVTVINNNYIGVYYVGTAFLFFVFAGILALIMRTQLAVPENDLVSSNLYNQLFTMHGTVMMFLFAVPAVEAMGVMLLPNMVGARDLPFPRLSAFAFWAYFVGGTVFFCSLFFDAAPRGGWFMYPPLTNAEYSPGINEDFWLLGIGFIEISAIAGAVEIIVGVLRTRSPGMTLGRMPAFAWSMLVFALMIVFAFPAVILATTLLELERAFGWPFFDARRGGDPLLWQHLFWFFGHPEVYIIFLPAAGMISMIVPTMARTPLVGYRLVVMALAGTGLLSFLLWVHHMFTTGVPAISLHFFSAASMLVAIPSGIMVFAWIATLAAGKLQWRTPALFVLGFLATFVIGGLSGVMVAMVPFDWQAHDTYFVVAHLHYVLFGGMVFPLFAAFYYWMPYASRRPLSERIGRWVFGLMFAGFNIAFFPMHFTGMAGMPRRVHTYPEGLGWEVLNLVSTLGAFMIAVAVLLFLIDVARNFRMAGERNAGDVWKAGSLEWLPSGNYSNRSIPIVSSREPLWDQPGLARDVEAGAYYLPGTATGRRETIVTSAIDARPQYLLLMPMPGWPPVLSAVFTAAFFLLLTAKLVAASVACGIVAVALILRWLWDTDLGVVHAPVDIGGGIRLPVYATGRQSHSLWASGILALVSGSLYASLVMSYLYLWSSGRDGWPAPSALPSGVAAIASTVLLLLCIVLIRAAGSMLAGRSGTAAVVAGLLATVALCAAFGIDLQAHLATGLDPRESAYGAIVYAVQCVQGFFVAVAVLMSAYTLARGLAGKVDAVRRVTFDNTAWMGRYVSIQGLAGVMLLHLFPRLA